MSLAEAVRTVAAHFGQRPRDEAPPRSSAVLSEACSRLGRTAVEYFNCRATAGWQIPRARTDETEEQLA